LYYTDRGDDELDELVEKAMKDFRDNFNPALHVISERPVYEYSKSIDLNVISNEYCKIAYEIAILEFGLEFAQNTTMSALRDIALGKVKQFKMGKTPHEMECWTLDKYSHYVILAYNKCIISVFGFRGMITIADVAPDVMRGKMIYYYFDPNRKKYQRDEMENPF
jgi:hypothetical protein